MLTVEGADLAPVARAGITAVGRADPQLRPVIAAAAQMLAGNEHLAAEWANDARVRNAHLTREDFFRAFPMKADAMRSRVSAALQKLGF